MRMRATEIIALLLEPQDREVALGDLAEQKQTGLSGFFAIADFVVRQQWDYWRDWRPWLAASAVAPATLLLLGASFQLSMDARGVWQGGAVPAALPWEALSTIAWAWASGFALGSLARRASWIVLLICAVPCLSCLREFHEPSLRSACLFLFLPPALWGAACGQRWLRMDFLAAVMLALATAGMMLLWHGMPVSKWLLLLVNLYLVLAAAGPARETADGHR